MFATWPQAVLSIFSPTFPFLSFRFLFCSFLFYSTIAKTINLGRLEGSISPTNKLFFFFFWGGDLMISSSLIIGTSPRGVRCPKMTRGIALGMFYGHRQAPLRLKIEEPFVYSNHCNAGLL